MPPLSLRPSSDPSDPEKQPKSSQDIRGLSELSPWGLPRCSCLEPCHWMFSLPGMLPSLAALSPTFLQQCAHTSPSQSNLPQNSLPTP